MAISQPEASPEAGASPHRGTLERLTRILAKQLGLDVESVDPRHRVAVLEGEAGRAELDVEGYLERLEARPGEVASLARRLFGDPEDLLRPEDVARVVARLGPWGSAEPLRAWVVGCGAGDPAYRLAFELVLRLGIEPESLTVFATDLDPLLLAEAGRGRLAGELVAQLPEGALDWLTPSGDAYLVKGSLRSRLAFARHDILRTPPFGRLDLLVCRQTLQHLTRGALEHALERFSFSLERGGLLCVHPSVDVSARSEVFESVDADLGLYRRQRPEGRPKVRVESMRKASFVESALAAMCRARQAAAIVVDQGGAIQAVLEHGAGVLGELRGGDPRRLAKRVDPRLEAPLERCLRAAREEGRPQSETSLVTSEDRLAELVVAPLERDGFLVEIRALSETSAGEEDRAEARVEKLERDLVRARVESEEALLSLRAENESLQDRLEKLTELNMQLRDEAQELASERRELELAREFLESRVEAQEALGAEADELFDSAEVAAIFLGPDAVVWRCTSAVATFLGAEPAIGDALPTSLVGERITNAVEEAFRTRRKVELQLTWRGRHVLVRALPRDLERTVGPGVVLTLADLSGVWEEAVEAEARVHQLASLFETANDPTVECRPSGEITYANAAARELLGLDGHEGAGIVDALRAAGARAPEEVADIVEAARHGLARPRVTVAFPSREQVFDVNARPLYAGGLASRVVVAARDVTELDKSQQAERASRALMQAVVDSLHAAIAVVDGEGRILSHNEAWAKAPAAFPGTRAQQGDALFDALALEHGQGREEAAMVEQYLRSVLSGAGAHESCRFPVQVDGMTRHVETTATRLSHAGEKLSVVVQSDVTSIKHAEQQKLEVQAKLLDADKAESLGVLAGGVAHDFNNLLVGILSNASFVLENLAPGSVEHECLKDVELASERAAELCRQLLAFSGRGQFTFEDLRVDALLEDSLRLLRASIPRAVDLEVTRPDRELPVIRGDASQIRQVLFNLVSNGAEAVVGSGKVRVTVGVEELTPDRIRAASHGGETQPGPHVYVRVVDDGAGMAEDVRARIFEPFFTTKFTGRGLGLAAVQGIVHGHRGALEVETGAGRGTRVTALFPVAVDAADGGEAISICPTVLVVDDEDFVRSAAHRALAHAGYEVVEAASGAEVLEMLDERLDELALVLLDITMPGMSGEEIYTRIRARSRSLPVLFSSGLPDLDDGGIVAPEGRTYFIRKPYRAQELVERVRVILEETA